MPTQPQVNNQFERTCLTVFGFPQNCYSGNISTFSSWYNLLHEEDREELLRCVRDYFDIDGMFIRRKIDNAVLMGGWTYIRDCEDRGQVPSTNPYFPTTFTGFIPFEFWLMENYDTLAEAWEPSQFEPVYTSSLDLNEVIHFLLWYIHYFELNQSIYVGRFLWTREIEQSVYLPARPLIHGSMLINMGIYYDSDYIAKEMSLAQQTPPTMIKRERTLLYLLRKIEIKWGELIKNQGAYTWLWFNNVLKTSARRRILNKGDTWKEAFEYIQKVIEKRTGKEWVYIDKDTGLFPKKMCKSYMTLDASEEEDRNFISVTWKPEHLVMKWKLASKWDRDQTNKKIFWDDEEKMWYGSNCRTNSKQKDVNGKPTIKSQTMNHNFFKNFKKCDCCTYFVKKEDLFEDQDLSITGCIFCFPDGLHAKGNDKVTQPNCYGGYHTHGKEWRFFYQRTPLDDPRSFCVGMEIEMHHNNKLFQNNTGSKNASWHILQSQWKLDDKLNQCYFERDGSLSPGGLEMITNPMSLAYHQWYWTLMLPVMREVCVGWNTEQFCGSDLHKNNYGIHMTFSRNWWTDLQLARLIKFIDNPANNCFVRALAQRTHIYNGEGLAVDKKSLRDKVEIRRGKIESGRFRYVPVNVKNGKLVELRFFRTTLNTESFLKNIEWFFAFYEWIKSTPFNVDAEAFIEWMLANQRGHGRYSNFFRYFSKEKFAVKGLTSLANPWKEKFKAVQLQKPLVFPIEPSIKRTPENIIKGDMECV